MFNSVLTVALSDGTAEPGVKLVNTIWQRLGSNVGEWKHAYVRLPPAAIDTFIRFGASMSSLNPGYAALDDVKLTLAECPHAKYCDFESDMCGFENDLSTNRKWLRAKSADAVLMHESTPKIDHTYQSDQGHFMLMLASRGRKTSERLRTRPHFTLHEILMQSYKYIT